MHYRPARGAALQEKPKRPRELLEVDYLRDFVQMATQKTSLRSCQLNSTRRSGGLLLDLSTFIVAVFCLIDDRLMDLGRLRARGPAPTLCDSEVLTIEVVGEFLGLDEDTELFEYFRRHYAHFFPNLRQVHRTTFTRQAANLWKAKELLWQKLLAETPHDPTFACVLREKPPSAKTPSSNRPFTDSGCTRGSAGQGSLPVCRWLRPTPTNSRFSPNSPSAPPVCSSGIATTTRPRSGRSWRAWA